MGDPRRDVVQRLGLDGEHDHVGRRDAGWIGVEREPVSDGEPAELRRGMGVDDGDAARGKPATEPALQHGPAHLAGPDQDERARQAVPDRRRISQPGYRHASPSVTNSTPSIASRADFPAQSTNWKAWK